MLQEQPPVSPPDRLRITALPDDRSGRACGETRRVGISTIAAAVGGRVVTNEELLAGHPSRSPEMVLQRIGIQSRRWMSAGETASTLAVRACREALAEARLSIDDVDLLICSTETAPTTIPSLACAILAELSAGRAELSTPAYDISAACTGYLYALRAAHDYLQSRPDGRVLVVTSAAYSRRLDHNDYRTFVLFGDAASATIVVGEGLMSEASAKLHPPVLCAKADREEAIILPADGGPLRMNGPAVFAEAVRCMGSALREACQRAGTTVDNLAMIVPHQANERILESMRQFVRPPIFSNIRTVGNTASSSIPIALKDCLPRLSEGASRRSLLSCGTGPRRFS